MGKAQGCVQVVGCVHGEGGDVGVFGAGSGGVSLEKESTGDVGAWRLSGSAPLLSGCFDNTLATYPLTRQPTVRSFVAARPPAYTPTPRKSRPPTHPPTHLSSPAWCPPHSHPPTHPPTYPHLKVQSPTYTLTHLSDPAWHPPHIHSWPPATWPWSRPPPHLSDKSALPA